jgi:hypothetical protein
MSMPSFDLFKSAPTTEALRLESEPPGADARTTQGQQCRTPCEVTVPAGADLAISFSLNGYQPQTIPVRADVPPGVTDPNMMRRLQPNPVYAELVPIGSQRGKKKGKGPPSKQRTVAKKSAPPAPNSSAGGAPTPADPNSAYPGGFPWPDPTPR